MTENVSIIVTSIHGPNAALRELARVAGTHGYEFILVGDRKSPADFHLDGCRYFDIASQHDTGFQLASLCPEGHYARKNIGYLIAIRDGATVIIDTDDDNFPIDDFCRIEGRILKTSVLEQLGWVNVYRYFSDDLIWPRGLPLDAIHQPLPRRKDLPTREMDCPVQQGLVNDDPDVDAIFRLVFAQGTRFRSDSPVALGRGSWAPFNSQNTRWWRDAFPLLYLPANCSFRMTDIWRGFVAQRILHEQDQTLLFHGPTARQERHEHDLLQDFVDEIPGYVENRRIGAALESLNLRRGSRHVPDNLRTCYNRLVDLGVVAAAELTLLDAWLADLKELGICQP